MIRTLVTTAIEETWPTKDEPILFLGKWCLLETRKAQWEMRKYDVESYHWDDRIKLHSDYIYVSGLYEKLLVQLTSQLNTLHNKNFSVRYWRIVIGPWLGTFIQILFDRWYMLRKVLTRGELMKIYTSHSKSEKLIPLDMNEFILLSNGDGWNEALYTEIIALCGFPIEVIASDRVNNCIMRGGDSNSSFSLRERVGLKQGIISLYRSLQPRDNEFFFIRTHLPLKQNVLTQLRLRQFPRLHKSPEIECISAKAGMRDWSIEFPNSQDSFLLLLLKAIPKHIPIVYLEGYESLAKKASNYRPWPKTPKTIFTSNSYFADDFFKIWAAEKVEIGSQLILAQHGGTYGMARWSFDEDHQLSIANQFLSWGWGESDKKNITKIGIIKNCGKRGRSNKKGFALLVQLPMPRFSYYMYAVPASSQWLDYFNDQCRFVGALPPMLQNMLLVRLTSYGLDWSQVERWKNKFPTIKLDDGKIHINDLIKKARLVIATYNSTTYLETLSLNIPTVIFWNQEHWELRASAEPYFALLQSVGILHDSPESASLHVSKIWDNVDAWWNGSEVQSARRIFCNYYAYIPSNPIKDLVDFFRNQLPH